MSLDTQFSRDEKGRLGDLIPGAMLEPEEVLGRAESSDLAHDLLDALPENLREVVTLYFFNEMKYAEISEVLDLPMGTVKSRLFRAMRQMASGLSEKRGY